MWRAGEKTTRGLGRHVGDAGWAMSFVREWSVVGRSGYRRAEEVAYGAQVEIDEPPDADGGDEQLNCSDHNEGNGQKARIDSGLLGRDHWDQGAAKKGTECAQDSGD